MVVATLAQQLDEASPKKDQREARHGIVEPGREALVDMVVVKSLPYCHNKIYVSLLPYLARSSESVGLSRLPKDDAL